MRRLVAPIAVLCLALSACAGGSTSTGGSTSSAGPAAPSSAATSESMTDEPMTEGGMPDASEPMTDPGMPGASEPMTDPSIAPPTSQVQPTGTAITTAPSDFGEILFDGAGQAIYLFDKETSTTADCYDECAAAWPPVLTTGAPAASGAVVAELLGTTTRTDGSIQVTYGGHPLYYYAGEGPNEVTCHNVDEFGGLWLVVTPTGQAAA